MLLVHLLKKNDIGGFEGEATDGNKVLFEITKSKSEAIASLKKIKVTDDFDLEVDGKYYALLIGNSNYVNWASKLKSPAKMMLRK